MLICPDHALVETRLKQRAKSTPNSREIPTLVATMAGLMRILWAHGTGSEVMSRIVVPIIGRPLSMVVFVVVAIPAFYAIVMGCQTLFANK